ncbi:MAG TPA: ligase-associated DNA damage response endonuclease PdeM [Sphingobacteriaceae bacterium]|nr:ligase-associated DNA damage response endonuclease PdeM [Sphingobacteriaceae bacterium]
MSDTMALEYLCKGQSFLLLPQKAILWQETQTLILADIHLGKVGHFRKSGIAIPKGLEQEDLAMMSDLIQKYKPKRLIFLGDLFHSELNNDWDWFVMWRELFKEIPMLLVKGNHDILHASFYKKLNFNLVDVYEEGPFLFTHEPLKPDKLVNTNQYIISGHIHPGVTLKGKGRQSVSLPCFYFGDRQAILPAFGKFTGKFCITHSADDKVFGVLKHKVISL